MIDKNVPIPAKKERRTYPWPDMDIGDSFRLEFPSHLSKDEFQRNVLSAGRCWLARNNKQAKIVSRRDETGVRFWMIEDSQHDR